MRLVARQDHGSYWKKKTQRVAIKREYRIKGPMSLSQLSTGAGEFERNSQDRNTKRERRRSQTRDNYRSRSIAHFGSSMASRARQPREAGQRGDEEGEEMEKWWNRRGEGRRKGGRSFFSLAGCNGSRGYWQSLTKRKTTNGNRHCVSSVRSSAHFTKTIWAS